MLVALFPLPMLADTARDWPAAGEWEDGIPLREVEGTCFYPPESKPPKRKFPEEESELLGCRLEHFLVLGNFDGRTLYSARYAYRVDDSYRPALHFAAVYEGDTTHPRVKPVFTFFDDGCTSEVQLPVRANTKYGPWLKAEFQGPPACWRTTYYFLSEGIWREVDFEAFRTELRAAVGNRFPPDGHCPVHAEDAVENDFVYESSVQLPVDCRACSSGGTVRAELAFEDGRIHVTRAEYTPPTVFDLLEEATEGARLQLQARIAAHPDEIATRNNEGQTLLTAATDSNDLAAVKMLLLAGANPREKDGRGESALDVATRRKFLELLKILQSSDQPSPGQREAGRTRVHRAD